MILSSSTYLYVKVEIFSLINDVNYKVDCNCWAFLFIIYNITSNWSIRFSCSSTLQGVHFAWNIISYIMFQHTIVINGDGDPDDWKQIWTKKKKNGKRWKTVNRIRNCTLIFRWFISFAVVHVCTIKGCEDDSIVKWSWPGHQVYII